MANATPVLINPSVSMPIERLEARMVELSSQIAGATCELLQLVADFDAQEAWRGWGLRSTAAWLSWKCGVGKTAAREQVRVARKLLTLPPLTAEFAAGRLSYSKVRSITRVATEDNIDTWISWAQTSTAAELDRIVAGYRKVTTGREDQTQRATRQLRCRWDEDGTLVGSFRLPPEDGMRLLQALELAKAALPEPVAEVEAIEDSATRPCKRCLNLCADAHKSYGCAGEAPHDCAKVIEDNALAGCADASAEALDARRPAKTMADALTFIANRATEWLETHGIDASIGLPGLGAERFQLVIHANAGASAGADPLLDAGFEDGPGLHPEMARRIACSCSSYIQTDDENGNPLHLGRKARRVRARLARAVHRRDRGRCRAPGCSHRTTQIHHIIHWADGGWTCIDNLISLCDSHHWLVHEGRWTITTLARGNWLFQRPDDSPMPHVIGAPIRLEPLPANPSIAADAMSGAWNGSGPIAEAVWWMANFGDRQKSATH